MEDISRDREEEENRPLERERKPEKRRRYETLPTMSYQEYEENIQKDMDIIFNPSFLNKDGIKFNHSKKEVKNIRRYLLDKILLSGIPSKFNSSTSSSDVFKNTTLEKDRKKSSSVIYVKYKDRTAFSYNTARGAIGERLRETDKDTYTKLQNDLKREIVEFKGDTFAGQVTSQLEKQSVNLGFIDMAMGMPEPKDYTPLGWQPSYRDVDDAQKEITGKMKMKFEDKKYDLESSLRQEENRRRRAEDNLNRTIQNNKEIVRNLNLEIKKRNERIQYLENQLRIQNFPQFNIDSTSREIQELKAEITRLENERDDLRQKIKGLEKDLNDQQQSIDDLQKQINEKQRKIEESSQNKAKVDQLEKEKADLEKLLQEEKERIKIVQKHRDDWKSYSDRDSASLAASEQKVLLLTKEVDDLNKTIENLKEVNSGKVKEFEDYKVEAEERLNKAKAEYIKDKDELENAYKRDISELESTISKLDKEKEEFSIDEIGKLKSLLESKNITIETLATESYRLRDLNLSLKSIDKNNKEEYDRKLKEIEGQKSKIEQSRKNLEEKLRKYVQKLKDKEKENVDLRKEIESNLSQLEDLNKKVSQSVDRKIFQANQNEFLKVQKELEAKNINVLDLQREKNAVEQREKEANNEINRLQERIEAKNKENTEYIEKFKVISKEKEEFNRKEKTFQQNIRDRDEKIRQKNVTLSRQKEELEELREKKEKLEDDIDKQRFKQQQFDRKTAEYNTLATSASEQITQGLADKDQLEEELKEYQRKLQELQKDLVDPKEHENIVKENKDLVKTINFLEKSMKQTEKIVIKLHDEKLDLEREYKKEKEKYEKDRKNFESYTKKLDQERKEDQEKSKKDIQKIRDNYSNREKKLLEKLENQKESYEFQLSQRLRPGDIKSVQILLNNLSLDDLDEENYRDAYIKYKTARDNFSKKADDETSSRVQRLMFEELKKLADIRLDLLNMSFNRSAKTEAGKEFIRRTDQTLAGKFYRFRMRVSKYLAGTTLGAGIMGVFYLIYDLMKTSMSASAVAYTYGKKLASKIGQAAWNSKKSTKAIALSGAVAYIDKSRKEGYTNTLYNWVYNLYYGLVYSANIGGRIIEEGFDALETVINTSANVAGYVANNTSTVFLMIISAIGIIITLKYSREK